MPTYTYECKRCSHSFDVFHGILENRRIKCEECGGPCKKLFGTGAGIIFKGSGFYETDYKNKSKGKEAKESKTEKTSSKTEGGDTKSSSKSDTGSSSSSKSSEGAKKEK